jgi:heat shock protein HslJ
MRPSPILVLLLGTAIVTGCTLLGGPRGGPIEGVRWILTGYPAEGAINGAVDEPETDATFAGGTLSGSGGCNAYSGPYTISGSSIDIGLLAATAMACGPIDEQEQAYFAALERVVGYTATDVDLQLKDASGASILFFKPAT